MNYPFLRVALRIWLTEILISGVNYVLLMRLLYEPRWGELTAHQVGMPTRIVSIFVLAFLMHVGVLWLLLTSLFEWGGSLLLLRRPVSEILVGWQIWQGYMWPYVLVAYLTANLIVGGVLHPGRSGIGLKVNARGGT